ncbi:uncharacterized protein N7482_008076 [Penicillium canariense]|uniref:Cytochrome b561 domain-containing protein n=1 Tax=Penicillium canariense TaxID=189055 RepID=A0A9W9HT30_9EURO|nr:uncharacterized protein N7482_008076 [Penicillium canariense]KAJ5156976.1 hypothetical protein N7482_008076 [Penicillium canariense]
MSDLGLTAAGSSTYSSNTLHVGDGTWDSQRDTFLLPNLMGVNFETMRYNGMGNRFKDMAGYHSIIIAHGVIATIVFLGLVPISTLIIRYYSRWNPFWAFKLHAWCQVLTLLLSTVVFVLGWFAVGPKRSLTNPHHGIGLAIYVMVIFQVLWGWFVHRKESKRTRHHVPLKLVIHRWMGRALAILGIVQIPLGLTLYGSPKILFILYALGAFALLVTYFVLSYLYDDEGFHMASEHGSRYTGPSVVEEHHGGGGGAGLGQALAGGALGAGLASIFRRRHRNTSQAYEESRTSYSDKYSDESSRHHGGGGGGWGKKLLEIGALAGAGMLAKKWWDRRRQREDDTESGHYKPAHSRSDSYTEDSLSRLEDARPEPARPPIAGRPPSHPPSRPQSPGSSYYYNSTYLSGQRERRASHGVRDALLGAGAFAAVKRLFSRNKDKDDEEKRRVEMIRRQEEEDEALQRANSKRRRQETGSGPYPQRRRPSPYSESDLTPTDLTPRPQPAPPRLASVSSMLSPEPMATGAAHGAPSDIPPLPPVHQELSGDFPSERPHSHHSHHAEELAAGAAAGAAMSAAASSHRRNSGSRRRDDSRRRADSRHRSDHVASPPVSVKVKMHNDGRHVTLRRLTEEEAAAQREARRRERRNSRRRGSSAGSLSGDEGRDYDRWRRVEELERQQAEHIQRERQQAAAAAASAAPSASVPPSSFHPSQSQISHVPPPPPVPPPAPSSMPFGAGSVASPGTWTGTEASGSYANNRRRRRAERARAKQDKQQHGVEFE